jgi:hypothetical protein
MVRWADVKVTGANGRTWAVLMEAPGVYVARDLEPGRYGIIVNAPKFRAADFEGMVNSRERTVVRAQLAIESLSERITVKATPLEGQPQTQVGSQQEILDLHETRESPAKDIGEALSRLDGVWKIRKGGIANDIVIRGFQQGNVVVLMDGARVFGACPNHMDPAAFHADFAEVRDVVVTKGAFNIRDQGSLGGTANVETKEAAPGLQFTPAIGAGSYGFYNPSLTGSWAGDRFSFLGGYSYRRSDPFRDGRGNPITRYSNYQRPDDAGAAFSAGTAWFKGGFTAGGGRATVSYTRQAADDVLYPYLLMDAGYDNANRLGLVYERFGTGLEAHSRAGLLEHRGALDDRRAPGQFGGSGASILHGDFRWDANGGRAGGRGDRWFGVGRRDLPARLDRRKHHADDGAIRGPGGHSRRGAGERRSLCRICADCGEAAVLGGRTAGFRPRESTIAIGRHGPVLGLQRCSRAGTLGSGSGGNGIGELLADCLAAGLVRGGRRHRAIPGSARGVLRIAARRVGLGRRSSAQHSAEPRVRHGAAFECGADLAPPDAVLRERAQLHYCAQSGRP